MKVTAALIPLFLVVACVYADSGLHRHRRRLSARLTANPPPLRHTGNTTDNLLTGSIRIANETARAAVNESLKIAGGILEALLPVQVRSTVFHKRDYKSSASYASAAYCVKPANITSCKGGCNGLLHRDTQFVYTTGDSAWIPYMFVAWSESQNRVIVSHEGTNITTLTSFLVNDADFLPAPLFPELNPKGKAPLLTFAHAGFQVAWRRTWKEVNQTVYEQLAKHKKSNPELLITGHSLGAAIALLDGLALRQSLPKSVKVRVDLYGLPRVGNGGFAWHVDQVLGDGQTHVVNKNDPVPHGPPDLLTLLYKQPSNEIFVNEGGQTLWCPGQDNKLCSSQFFKFDNDAHLGPYFGVHMGGKKACEGWW